MDEIELLRELRADLPGPDRVQRERARQALIERAQAAGNLGRSRLGGPGKTVRWRRVAMIAAVAAGLAISLPTVFLDGGGVQSAAAEALRQAARVAAAEPTQAPPEPGQFVYTRTKAAYLTTTVEGQPAEAWSVLIPELRESWIGPDGSGRVRVTNGKARFLSAEERAAWRAAGSPRLATWAAGPSDTAFRPGRLYYLDVSRLPTDSEALREVLEARKIVGGPPGDAETFTIIGDLLRETYVPPALRAALYEVAAGLPGIELLGRVEDAVGREGIGVAYTHEGQRKELIFDPETAALLGARDVLVGPPPAGLHVPAGTVIGYAAFLASGVVDSTSTVPAAPRP
jgi:hypothetical protein